MLEDDLLCEFCEEEKPFLVIKRFNNPENEVYVCKRCFLYHPSDMVDLCKEIDG